MTWARQNMITIHTGMFILKQITALKTPCLVWCAGTSLRLNLLSVWAWAGWGISPAFPRWTPWRKFRAHSLLRFLFSSLDLLIISSWCTSSEPGWILFWTSVLNECCASRSSQQIVYRWMFSSCPVYPQITPNNRYFHPVENAEIWNESRSGKEKAEAHMLGFSLPLSFRF